MEMEHQLMCPNASRTALLRFSYAIEENVEVDTFIASANGRKFPTLGAGVQEQLGITVAKSRQPSSKHMNAHERVFRCLVGGCSSSFTRDSDLRRHDESVHQKIVHFWCTIPECAARQVSFARKDHFMQHLSKHASPVGTVPGPATEKAKAGPTRKRRRGSSFDESGARDDNKGEMLRLRAENERLQDTVKKLTETLHALILKKN